MYGRQFSIFQKILFSLLGLALIPVIIASVVAVRSISLIGYTAQANMEEIGNQIHHSAEVMRSDIINDSIKQHDAKSTLAIETRTRDIAGYVASFLYGIDSDVLSMQAIVVSPESFLTFYKAKKRLVTIPESMVWSDDEGWVPESHSSSAQKRQWVNEKNKTNWHYNQPLGYTRQAIPLFKEITYVGLDGQEIVKISHGQVSKDLRNISNPKNTFAGAETYFEYLPDLLQGELYVSPVVGAYQPFWGGKPGSFDPRQHPESSPEMFGYAGRENPNGTRFDGLIRWVLPIFKNGRKVGYITCALDHRHLQELIEHIHPTPETYTQHPDGGSGNYAFLWDNQSRSIVHPRHYFICGYDKDTGEPVPGWTGATKDTQLASGRIPLDCRKLDFAPQCQGWENITAEGGNGSFQIFWSGLSKLTTVATVNYHTGQNYKGDRGFGYVTLGANVDDFHEPSIQASTMIGTAIDRQQHLVDHAVTVNKTLIAEISTHTSMIYLFLALFSCFAVTVVAYFVSRNITLPLQKVSDAVHSMEHGTYQTIMVESGGEVGQLVDAFNNMVRERQKVAEELLENESRYRNLFETSPNGIIIYHNRQVCDCNDEMVNLFRVASKHNIIGKGPSDLSTDVQPSGESSAVAIEAFLADVFTLGFKKTDWQFKRFDGEKFYAEILASSFMNKGKKMIHATIRDVTARRKSERQIEKARLAAEEANQAKSIFLANMSHEIRTPMNGIMGMASILAKTRLDANQQRCVELMNTSAQRLLRILNDILDFSLIESGKMGLSQHVFDVGREMEQTFGMLRVAAEEKRVEFLAAFADDVPDRLYGDAGRIAQIVINLVMNGIKFTPAGGAVSVRVGCYDLDNSSVDAVGLCLEIKDTGIGIPVDQQQMVFEPFTQADASHTRKYGGSGLGLAITAELTAMMNGHLEVESQEGRGTVFRVFLPLAMVSEHDEGEISVIDGVPTDTDGVLQGCSVLLVEDEVVNQVVIQEMLKPYGVVLESVLNGSACLMKIKVRKYDLILLDVQLPDYDGYDIAPLIRDDQSGLNCESGIIGVSAHASPDIREKCMRCGMDGFVSKPVAVKTLVTAMVRLLRQK